MTKNKEECIKIGDIVEYCYSDTSHKWGYVAHFSQGETTLDINWFDPAPHMDRTLWMEELNSIWYKVSS